MMKIIDQMVQGSPEWMQFRRRHVTATDASVILGCNPFRTTQSLWEEKVLGWEQEFTPKQIDRMNEGQRLEPLARDYFCRVSGMTMIPMVAEHPVHDFLSASFDGMTEDHLYGIEIKCGKKAMFFAQNGEIPSYYYCQIQHQLMINRLEFMFYLAYTAEDQIILEVPRDEDYQKKLLEEEKIFWHHVTTQKPILGFYGNVAT
jgi:putative phage-type endonuclease